MSIKKVNTKVDFIKSEHDVLDFWKVRSFRERSPTSSAASCGASRLASSISDTYRISMFFIAIYNLFKRFFLSKIHKISMMC